MQIMISCAKDISSREEVMAHYGVSEVEMRTWPATRPAFAEAAVEAAGEMSQWSAEAIAGAMKCSEDIAEMNQLRFAQFCLEPDERYLLQAAATYSGVAFKHLRMPLMSPEEKEFANGHLWIMSFLYGLLRPMDLILPYRMEGNVKLKVHGGKSMFDWWREKLTDTLLQAINADDGTLLWCSTEEMKRMVDWKRLVREVKVIEPDFLVSKNGKQKSMSVYAKMCRGAMARQVIVAGSEGQTAAEMETGPLRDFQYQGFSFSFEGEPLSDLSRKWVYLAEK